jgi:hypothetical protein
MTASIIDQALFIERGEYTSEIIQRLQSEANASDQEEREAKLELLADVKLALSEGEIVERKMIVTFRFVEDLALTLPRLTEKFMRGNIWWEKCGSEADIPSAFVTNGDVNGADLNACLNLSQAAWGKNYVIGSVLLRITGTMVEVEAVVYAETPQSLTTVMSSLGLMAASNCDANDELFFDGYMTEEQSEVPNDVQILENDKLRQILRRGPLKIKLHKMFMSTKAQQVLVECSSRTLVQFDRCAFEDDGTGYAQNFQNMTAESRGFVFDGTVPMNVDNRLMLLRRLVNRSNSVETIGFVNGADRDIIDRPDCLEALCYAIQGGGGIQSLDLNGGSTDNGALQRILDACIRSSHHVRLNLTGNTFSFDDPNRKVQIEQRRIILERAVRETCTNQIQIVHDGLTIADANAHIVPPSPLRTDERNMNVVAMATTFAKSSNPAQTSSNVRIRRKRGRENQEPDEEGARLEYKRPRRFVGNYRSNNNPNYLSYGR